MACNEGWKIVDRYIDTLENLGEIESKSMLFSESLLALETVAADILGHINRCVSCSNGSLPLCTSHRCVLPTFTQIQKFSLPPAESRHSSADFGVSADEMLGF